MHLVYYLCGQILTVGPMIWLGYWGMPRRILDYPYSLGGWHSLASVGHMVAMTGIFCFYIMMYDSVRQSRAAVRNTFGIARFNTRLNFFMFEYYKLTYVNYRSWFMYRTPNLHLRSKKKVDYLRLVLINTTLFSYSFHK
jgi:heme/copper-type cytochrome/quinol oxidase subunit 1